jgi:hypothetical protein
VEKRKIFFFFLRYFRFFFTPKIFQIKSTEEMSFPWGFSILMMFLTKENMNEGVPSSQYTELSHSIWNMLPKLFLMWVTNLM